MLLSHYVESYGVVLILLTFYAILKQMYTDKNSCIWNSFIPVGIFVLIIKDCNYY